MSRWSTLVRNTTTGDRLKLGLFSLLVGASMSKDLWFDHVPERLMIPLLLAVSGSLGLYIGAYFWILSDPRMVLQRDE